MAGKDRTGERYGRLVVVGPAESRHDQRRWLVRCDCGVEKVVWWVGLYNGDTKSCGCLRADRNAARKIGAVVGTPEYSAWAAMRGRCFNRNHPEFFRYGGRGIRVCSKWKNSFSAFLSDMGPRPSPQHSIDRRNNDGDYEPANCRWATRGEQLRNTRRNRWITFAGETKTMLDWSLSLGGNRGLVYARVDRLGWSEERAVSTPAQVRT